MKKVLVIYIFSFSILFLIALMGMYFFWNTEYTETGFTAIRKQPMGFEVKFLKIKKNQALENKKLTHFIFGYDENYTYIPIMDSVFIEKDSIYFRHFPGKEPKTLSFSLAECVFSSFEKYTHKFSQNRDTLYYLNREYSMQKISYQDVKSTFYNQHIETHFYPLGTDADGRDLAVMLYIAFCITFFCIFSASILSIPTGLLIGILLVINSRWEEFFFRLIKLFLFFPPILTVIILSMFLSLYLSSFWSTLFSVSFVAYFETLYLVFRRVSAYLKLPFMKNILITRIKFGGLIYRYVIPQNIRGFSIIIFYVMSRIAIYELIISFIGLGLQFPLFSIASLLQKGFQQIGTLNSWNLVLFPAILATLIISFLNIFRFALLVEK